MYLTPAEQSVFLGVYLQALNCFHLVTSACVAYSSEHLRIEAEKQIIELN